MELYLGGYVLAEGQTRKPWMAPWLPPITWSISHCICRCYPGVWGFSWTQPDDTELAAVQTHLGLNDDQMQDLLEQSDRAYDTEGSFGWPNFWIDLDAARRFSQRYLTALSTVKLLGIAIPATYFDASVEILTPTPGSGETGLYLKLIQRLPPSPGGQALGFEILGQSGTGFFHSFLCNGLEKDYRDKLGLTLNRHGLLDSYSDAERATAYTNEDSGAELVLWGPWLVLEYPLA